MAVALLQDRHERTTMRNLALVLALTLLSSGSLTACDSAWAGDSPNIRVQPPHAARAATSRPIIELRGGLLSVRVRHAPWDAVLEELGRQTGILIRADAPLVGTLTQEFDALPLEQGLRRLFRDVDLLFVYEPETKKRAEELIRLRLFPKDKRQRGRLPRARWSRHGAAECYDE